ncbi:MAG: hypothetical protein V1912_00055 [bacterium]
MNLSSEVKVTTALDYAEANADRNGAILDMSGFEGVLMVVKFAAIAAGAVTSIKAQQDTAVGGGTMADLVGTGITVAANDDDQIFIIDLVKPRERYVRLVIDKDAANNTAESAIYIQYGAHKKPVVQTVTDAVTYERHVSPAEGTA